MVDFFGVPDISLPVPLRTSLAQGFCGPRTIFRLPCYVLLDLYMGTVRTHPQEVRHCH